MCEGWPVTVCLSEHKWTLLSLLTQLFQTLSMLCDTLARQLRTTGRNHAAFALSRAGLTVRDLQSKNRTYVGGKAVFAASLSSGDAVTLGRTGPEIVVLMTPPALASTQTEFG